MERSENLQIRYLAPDALTPDRNNARTHSKAQIGKLVRSIEAFGFTNPILIDEAQVVIAGHGRLRAAKEAGLAQVPTIAITGLTEAEKKALRLADNKIALEAGWDTDLLKAELAALSEINVDIDLSLTGFSTGEIDVLLSPADDPDDELVPDCPKTPRAKLGEIYALGPHRLLCGDGRDRELLDRLMEGSKAYAAFLDPPYNVKINGFAKAQGRHPEFQMASGEMTREAFVAFLKETLGNAAAFSKDGAVHFVAMDWRHWGELDEAARAVYGSVLNVCVWNKSNAGMGSLYRSKHELIFVLKVGTAPHFNAVELGKHGRNRTNVWDYASVNSLKGSRREDLALHPTVKPVAMVADALCDVTRQGETALDLFTGSGTTLIAAERTGRRFVGAEIEPAYVDVAIERWEVMTGKRAQLMQESADA